MPRQAYALYLTTFTQASEALRARDDERLRALCSDVAGRGGVESTVSLMAISDAERGARPRARGHVLGVFWRETVAFDRAQAQQASARVGRAA